MGTTGIDAYDRYTGKTQSLQDQLGQERFSNWQKDNLIEAMQEKQRQAELKSQRDENLLANIKVSDADRLYFKEYLGDSADDATIRKMIFAFHQEYLSSEQLRLESELQQRYGVHPPKQEE